MQEWGCCGAHEIARYLLAMGANKFIPYRERYIDLLAFNNRNIELIRLLDLPFSSALSIFYGAEVSENTPALFDNLCEKHSDLMALIMSKPCVDGAPFLVKLYDTASIHIIYSLQKNADLHHSLPEDYFTAERYLHLGGAIIKSVSGLEMEKKEFLLKLLPNFCEGMNKLHLLILADDAYVYKDFMSENEDTWVYLYQEYEDQFPLEMAMARKNYKLASKILTYDVSYADAVLSRLIVATFESQYYLGLLLLFEKFFPLLEENILPLVKIIIENSMCYALFVKAIDVFYESYPRSRTIDHLLSQAVKEPLVFYKLYFLVSRKDIPLLLSCTHHFSIRENLVRMEEKAQQYGHIMFLYERAREDDGPCRSLRLGAYRNQLRQFYALHQHVLTYDVRVLMQARFTGKPDQVCLRYGDVQELIDTWQARQVPRYQPLTRFFSVCGAGDARTRTLAASVRELQDFCEGRDFTAVVVAEEIDVLRAMVQREASLYLVEATPLQDFSAMPIFRQLDEILNLLYPMGADLGLDLTRGPGAGK